jgi:hypothetical protein
MKKMSTTHCRIIFLLSLALLLNGSCSKETIKTLSDLSALRGDLIKEYKVQDVNVTVQGSNVLGISFINSSFNKLGEQERENKAREIALFAKNHYPAIKSIDRIWVSFVIAKNYIVFHYSNSLATYVFEKSSLAPTAASGNDEQQGVVTASYNSTSNQTSVYLNNNLQVYREGGNGIMLFPNFNIPGDNVSAPRIVTPKSVVLDFSTYGDKRMFTDNPKLVIYVDNQKIFSGTARTTRVLGSNAERSVNEFLSQEISYNQFSQLVNGKQAKFILGEKELELTPSHLQELRALKRCAEELRCT